jgi:hypothetical protein
MKACYKSDLAMAAGVSMGTFRSWIKRHECRLMELGYRTRDKVLNPAVVEYLCKTYSIDM